MFRHAHCLSGGAGASEAQCRSLVEAAVKACETYYQSFQFVLWAGRTPARGHGVRDVRDGGGGVREMAESRPACR